MSWFFAPKLLGESVRTMTRSALLGWVMTLVACSAPSTSSAPAPVDGIGKPEAGATGSAPVLDAAEPQPEETGTSVPGAPDAADDFVDEKTVTDVVDAAVDAGAGCAGAFCEDFETGKIDPGKWDLVTGAGGTAEVESDTVAHGKFALHVHAVSGPSDYALIVSKSAPAALKGTHFGRAYFYITPKPLTSGHTQMVFAGINGTGSANGPGPFSKLRYMEVANINGGWQTGFDLLDIAPLVEEVYYPAGSPQVPTTAWTCLEWEFSDAPDIVDLWVDGKSLGQFDDSHVSYPAGHAPGTPLYNGKSSGLIGSFEVFGFGFHDWHPNKPFDLYYDDIVLDTKRINCL
jgi:hypothetical protein